MWVQIPPELTPSLVVELVDMPGLESGAVTA